MMEEENHSFLDTSGADGVGAEPSGAEMQPLLTQNQRWGGAAINIRGLTLRFHLPAKANTTANTTTASKTPRRRALNRQQSSINVLSNVDIFVPVGSVYVLLGGEGCGKTTALQLIATFPRISPWSWFENAQRGANCVGVALSAQVAKRVGFVDHTTLFNFAQNTESGGWLGTLGVIEAVVWFGRINGLSDLAAKRNALELVRVVGLVGLEDTPLSGLGPYHQHCVSLCIATVHMPTLLLVDHVSISPSLTTASNPLFPLIHHLKKTHQTTTVIATNSFSVAAHADTIAIMHNGMLLLEESPHDLVAHWRDAETEDENASNFLPAIDDVENETNFGNDVAEEETTVGTLSERIGNAYTNVLRKHERLCELSGGVDVLASTAVGYRLAFESSRFAPSILDAPANTKKILAPQIPAFPSPPTLSPPHQLPSALSRTFSLVGLHFKSLSWGWALFLLVMPTLLFMLCLRCVPHHHHHHHNHSHTHAHAHTHGHSPSQWVVYSSADHGPLADVTKHSFQSVGNFEMIKVSPPPSFSGNGEAVSYESIRKHLANAMRKHSACGAVWFGPAFSTHVHGSHSLSLADMSLVVDKDEHPLDVPRLTWALQRALYTTRMSHARFLPLPAPPIMFEHSTPLLPTENLLVALGMLVAVASLGGALLCSAVLAQPPRIVFLNARVSATNLALSQMVLCWGMVFASLVLAVCGPVSVVSGVWSLSALSAVGVVGLLCGCCLVASLVSASLAIAIRAISGESQLLMIVLLVPLWMSVSGVVWPVEGLGVVWAKLVSPGAVLNSWARCVVSFGPLLPAAELWDMCSLDVRTGLLVGGLYFGGFIFIVILCIWLRANRVLM